MAALKYPLSMPSMVRVDQRVKIWIEPQLYKVLMIDIAPGRSTYAQCILRCPLFEVLVWFLRDRYQYTRFRYDTWQSLSHITDSRFVQLKVPDHWAKWECGAHGFDDYQQQQGFSLNRIVSYETPGFKPVQTIMVQTVDEPRIRPGVETQFIFQFKTIIYSIAAYTFHLLQRVNAECYALEGYSQHKLILKLDLLTGPHGLGRRGVPSNQGHIKIHLKTWLQDVDSDGDICATQREQEITRGTSTNGLTAVSLTENVAVHGSLRIRAAWTTSVQWTEESELTQEIVDVMVEQWDRSCGPMINKTAGSAEGLRILPGSTIL
ncbi:hypothetical protein B0H13DRAFT_1868444 [Mycena leptocephala]|nr:hypothetical protein B0H13DRAFT_1868444 [Mycena leptocephala]